MTVLDIPVRWLEREPDSPPGRRARKIRQLRCVRAAAEQVIIDLSGGHSTVVGALAPRCKPVIAAYLPICLHPMPRWKRRMDIVGAGLCLLILLPLMALIAACIKLTSRGPVLFTQRRAGFGGTPFLIYKFRTMVAGAESRKQELLCSNEQDGPVFKMSNDPRLTRLGRFLRRSSLDELPQLWNVLKGEMSLVGPRPLACDEANRCEDWQRQRLGVVPGITCIWQVSGRSLIGFNDWVRMDLDYIRRRSPLTDLRILLQTIPAVLMRRGAK
jgi:lipopolysaccharide/colanic/teichoic acid biosynthesis glycosyltransferase